MPHVVSVLAASVSRAIRILSWPTLYLGGPTSRPTGLKVLHANVHGLVLRGGVVECARRIGTAFAEPMAGAVQVVGPEDPVVAEGSVRAMVGPEVELLALVLAEPAIGWCAGIVRHRTGLTAAGDSVEAWSREMGVSLVARPGRR